MALPTDLAERLTGRSGDDGRCQFHVESVSELVGHDTNVRQNSACTPQHNFWLFLRFLMPIPLVGIVLCRLIKRVHEGWPERCGFDAIHFDQFIPRKVNQTDGGNEMLYGTHLSDRFFIGVRRL